jgi:hypothetical protein
MQNYNQNKKIKIEIRQCVSPALGYEIWENKEGGKCIERDADENDIEYILMPEQYQKFLQGKFNFIVYQNVLTNLFSYFS